MDGFPTALHLASEESVFQNYGVLFHLVRPTKTGNGVESAVGLANVIPRKRIYRMETPEELNLFKIELLKRPLVIQPSAYSGYGLGKGLVGCGLFVKKVNWVALINQTHPKILGRLQMGVDAALQAMEKKTPFLLRYKFGNLLQRLHYDIFPDGLSVEESLQDWSISKFRYANWDFGELVVRYPGPVGSKKSQMINIQFLFEDINPEEIRINSLPPNCPVRPLDNPIDGDTIRNCLPGWTVNEITPLENIGETAPVDNYSYAQAGRLYESFRKKKKQRPDAEKKPRDNPGYNVAIELDEILPSVSKGAMAGPLLPGDAVIYPPQNSHVHGSSSNYIQSQKQYNDHRHDNRQYQHVDGKPDQSSLYPDVQIVDKSKPQDWYNKTDASENYTPLHLNGRDSNQSSFSTAASSGPADSGYHGNESERDYYDKHYYDNGVSKHASAHQNPSAPQENLGFSPEDDSDEIMIKHKEFVSNMLKQQGNSVTNINRPPRSKDRGYSDHNKENKNYDGSQNGHAQNGYGNHNPATNLIRGSQNTQGYRIHNPAINLNNGAPNPQSQYHREHHSPRNNYEYGQHAGFKFGAESISESFI